MKPVYTYPENKLVMYFDGEYCYNYENKIVMRVDGDEVYTSQTPCNYLGTFTENKFYGLNGELAFIVGD